MTDEGKTVRRVGSSDHLVTTQAEEAGGTAAVPHIRYSISFPMPAVYGKCDTDD